MRDVPPDLQAQVQEFIKQQISGEQPIPREQHNAQQAKGRKREKQLEERVKELESNNVKLTAAAAPDVGEVIRAALEKATVTEGDNTFLDPAKAAEATAEALQTLLSAQTNVSTIDVDQRIEEAMATRNLSSEQRDAVREIRERFPEGLTSDQVMKLTRVEHPELFRETANQAGTPFAGQPGRGSAAEAETQQQPSTRDVADFLFSLPPDDPRAQDAGPYMIKADMDANFPNIHGRRRL